MLDSIESANGSFRWVDHSMGRQICSEWIMFWMNYKRVNWIQSTSHTSFYCHAVAAIPAPSIPSSWHYCRVVIRSVSLCLSRFNGLKLRELAAGVVPPAVRARVEHVAGGVRQAVHPARGAGPVSQPGGNAQRHRGHRQSGGNCCCTVSFRACRGCSCFLLFLLVVRELNLAWGEDPSNTNIPSMRC